MRATTYLILIVILLSPVALVRAETKQGGINARGIVDNAEISGIDEGELSQGLRDAVRKLIGQPFDQQAAEDLVSRIQAEKPEFVATTRLAAGNQPDGVKVIFLLEKTSGEPGSEANVNSRYTVERVEIQGFDESRISQSIRDELKTLVGQKLDQDKADQLRRRIEDELRPRHYVNRRVTKGSDRQHIVVVYEVHKIPLIPYIALPSPNFIYHSKQNFSAAVNLPIPLGGGNRLFLGLADDQDQLLERFAGFNLGFESTNVGTDRLGLALRYSRYHDRWQPATVSADANAVYRERSSFDPTITFAFDPRFRLKAGVSLSDLQMQYPAIHRANANAAVVSLTFHNVWGKRDEDLHGLQASYDFRSGNHSFNSDFIYTRHFGQVQYVYGHRHNNLRVLVSGGEITGNAPLFERFSLGDASTLRGWNKFDVAPLGGNRMVHATLQYGFSNNGNVNLKIDPYPQFDVPMGFHVFYDTGAVGDRGAPMKARHSAGIGFGTSNSARFLSNFFIELGFPIRSSRVEPVFTMGFRF